MYRAYRTLLTHEELRSLSHLKPWRPVVDSLWMWSGILLAWALVAWHPTWWTVLIAIPVVGTRFYGLFIIGHDGMHRRIFNKTSTNDLFCDLFIFGPIGAITRINNRNHMDHHVHLATQRDPDRHKHACFNKSSRQEYLFFLTGLMNLLTALGNVYGKRMLNADRPNPDTERQTSRRYSARDLAILAGWQAALIGGLTIWIGWWAYPLLWIFPVYIHAYLADLVRSFLEHAQPESDESADRKRLITYTSNPLERLILAPMSMNYHAAHHLWTSIPYYNLKRADAKLRRRALGTPLEWRRSYLGFALRYFLALPIPECRQDKTPNPS